MSTHKTPASPAELEALSTWANEGEFDPAQFRGEALRGAEAAAAGRAMLAAAGVDVDQIDRTAGRPRLDPTAPKGTRSPRVNVAIPETLDARLKSLARTRGVKTSVIVREALDAFIRAS